MNWCFPSRVCHKHVHSCFACSGCKHYDGLEDTSAESTEVKLIDSKQQRHRHDPSSSCALAITRIHRPPSDFILPPRPMAAVASARFLSCRYNKEKLYSLDKQLSRLYVSSHLLLPYTYSHTIHCTHVLHFLTQTTSNTHIAQHVRATQDHEGHQERRRGQGRGSGSSSS